MTGSTWRRMRMVAALPLVVGAMVLGVTSAGVRPAAHAQTPPPTGTWASIGPNSARVQTLAIDPNGKLYAGTPGGVWTSTDGGKSWNTTTDGQPSTDISGVAIDPTNTSTVYAATGQGGDSDPGLGVLKSTDGGASWTLLNPGGVFTNTSTFGIAVDSRGAVYVPTDKGLFISTDGGNTFPTQLAAGMVVDTLALDSNTNPTTIYADVQPQFLGLGAPGPGIEKSTDGQTFTPLTTGLPTPGTNAGQYQGAFITLAPSNHLILYASLRFGQRLLGVWKSTDAGATWTQNPPASFVDFTQYGNFPGGQAASNNVMSVDPANPNNVYGGGVRLALTKDGGATWNDWGQQNNAVIGAGVDFHSFAWDAQGNLYIGGDQGLSVVTPAGRVNDLSSNLGARMFYRGMAMFGNAQIIEGGTQDQGAPAYYGGSWHRSGAGGDGFSNAIDPLNQNVQFEYASNGLWRTTDAWGTTMTKITPRVTGPAGPMDAPGGVWARPIAVAPNANTPDAPRLYYGAGQIWVSPDAGATWSNGNGAYSSQGASVNSIAVAPSNPLVAYVGFTDGTMQVTNDGGANWTTMAPPSGAPNCNACVGNSISYISVNPTDPTQVAVTFSQTSMPHVVTGTAANTATPTWTEVTGNLGTLGPTQAPSQAANVVVFNGNGLIVGTDKGTYSGTPNGATTTWTPTAAGLPQVPTRDMALAQNGILTAMTFGRGAWQTLLPALSSNGSGTMTVSPSTVATGSSTVSLAFTFTAATGGLNNGEVDVQVPTGWTAPTTTNTSASTGTVGTNGQTIQVTGVTLGAGATLTITYGTQGNAVTAQGTNGNALFTTSSASASGSAPVPIAASPTVSVTATGGAVPGAPTGVTTASTGTCGTGFVPFVVSWVPPTFTGGSPITAYNIYRSGSSRPTNVNVSDLLDPNAPSQTICLQPSNTPRSATVSAINGNGEGPQSSPPSTPLILGAIAPPPTNVLAVVGNGQAEVMWNPPSSNNGGVITGYTVTVMNGNQTVKTVNAPAGADSAIVTGLQDGTDYTVAVTTDNQFGDSAPCDTNMTPTVLPGVPYSPTNVMAQGGNGRAIVAWTAPNANGSPIQHYTVTAYPGEKTVTVPGTQTYAVVAGLSNGVGYYFTVHGTNAQGSGPESDASPNAGSQLDQSGLTEMGATPSKPQNVYALPENGQLSVSWDVPASNGGLEISKYEVIATPYGPAAVARGATRRYVDIDGDTTSAVLDGLQNGASYTISVIAVNAYGPGPAAVAAKTVAPLACTLIDGADGNVTVGGVSCVTGTINGNLTVPRGATALISDATITGNLNATGAAGIQMCGTTVEGATAITSSKGFLLLGEPLDWPCDGNALGPVRLIANTGGLDFLGNEVTGDVTVNQNVGIAPSAGNTAPLIGYNDVEGSLLCTNNVPNPVNGGSPNYVTGFATGQCRAISEGP